jgi:hypothetical protein
LSFSVRYKIVAVLGGILPARKLKTLRYCIASVVLAVLDRASISSASTITFSDSVFAPSNWTLTEQQIQNGGTASASQLLTGGKPNECRQVSIGVNAGSNTAVYAFSLDSQAYYTPSVQGAITALTYAEDHNSVMTGGQEYGPALLQDGILYYGYGGAGTTGGTGPMWQAATNTAFTSSNIGTYLGANNNPNFTSTGDPIEFGFVSIDNTLATNYNTTEYYDNWSISLTTTGSVPEPASAAAVMLVGALLSRRRAGQREFKAVVSSKRSGDNTRHGS